MSIHLTDGSEAKPTPLRQLAHEIKHAASFEDGTAIPGDEIGARNFENTVANDGVVRGYDPIPESESYRD